MERATYNLSAGPAVMPEAVLKKCQADMWEIAGSGMGVMELSHRGPYFKDVLAQTTERCRKLASIPDDYDVLYMTGGATQQFWQIPANFLTEGKTADYWMTGAWAKKAAKDAARYGTAHHACSSEDKNCSYIPGEANYSDSPAYVHFTSNNTIFGTQHVSEPTCPDGAFLVCDASSDIFSRPIDVSKYGLIYAGSQKNLGPAGVTLVIAHKDVIAKGSEDMPAIQQYRTFADNDSCANTPPAFPIYAIGETFQWLLDMGGLPAIEATNKAKAKVLYDYLDESKLFQPTAAEDSRSLMNVCFVTGDADIDAAVIKTAKAAGFDGLKGHRSVGGMRASIYNAFPAEGVDKLVDVLKAFEASR